MDKLKNKKAIVIISAVLILAVAAGLILYFFVLRKDSYRNIVVFEINGKATVTREGNSIDAYKGMQLQSGDSVKVPEGEGYMYLLLDDDKYVLLEPNTEINVAATGSVSKGAIKINLVSGAIVNQIKNKLDPNSTYEVNTPASTMAVRGTVFRVCVTKDENGNPVVTIQVFEGKVASRLLLPDGTYSQEERLIEGGKAAQIKDNEYVFDNQNIDYKTLPVLVLNKILGMIEKGEIDALIPDKGKIEDAIRQMNAAEQNKNDSQTEEDKKDSQMTVNFCAGGTVWAKQNVRKGSTVSKPALSPNSGSKWYQDEAHTKEWDFSSAVEEDMNLYAGN